MDTVQLLDLAKSRQGVSDYGLARILGVGQSTLSNYRNGRSRPDDRMAVRLADLAQLDAGQVVAWLNAERAKDDESRRLWQGIAERLARTVVAAMILMIGITGGPDAMARNSAPAGMPNMSHGGPVYIMSNALRAWRRRLAGALAWIPPFGGLRLALR